MVATARFTMLDDSVRVTSGGVIPVSVVSGNVVEVTSGGTIPRDIHDTDLPAISTAMAKESTLGGVNTNIIATPGAVWDELAAGHVAPGTMGEFISYAVQVLDELLDINDNKLTFDPITSELCLWNNTATAVIKRWPLKDNVGNPVNITGTGPANREARTL